MDTRQVRRNFDRAAPNYDAAAFLPREIGRRMLERLDCVRLDPARVLDLG
ncbi:MAG: malonyl-[acyl-carrier protein] O-methyltransferase BioC, partial [Candidatus Accumulibacter sp.]|nr:malonyl-[acyl-carrier protein] O-methyltransferase BioC [Accumulibacter sp.]